MLKASRVIRRFITAEVGATMLEYGFMIALIALVCALAVGALGTGVSGLFTGATAGFAG